MSFRQRYLEFIQRRPAGPADRITWAFLRFLSHLYLAGWWLKRLAYRFKLIPRRHLPCLVVSVGNLTTGGTGKTPIVISLAQYFISKGLRVAVLSRGYGGRRKGKGPLWVSDGNKILAGALEAGDEPVLIANKVPKAAMVVCADRYRSGLEAIQRFKPDMLILDDGFQRRFSLHRDLDILVVDGIHPFSTGRVLPAGLLREPMNALADASVFVLNKVNFARSPQDIKTVLAKYNSRAPVVESTYKPTGLRDLATGKMVKPSQLENVPVGVLAGIGNPISFVRTLADFNVVVSHSYPVTDHFVYTPESLNEIAEDARQRGLLYLVTTEKDEVKIPKSFAEKIPVLVLDIEWAVTGGQNQWQSIMKGLELTGGGA
jgi:tetraacyldisaccharide 4'-kinase